MLRSLSRSSLACCLAAALAVVASTEAGAADLPVSTTARGGEPVAVDLFDAVDAGQVEARVVMQNAGEGTLVVRNLGNADLNLTVPETFGVQHVLPQFGGGGAGGFGGGGGGGGGQAGGGGAGGGFGGGGGAGGGGGFFSVPAGQIRRADYAGVCLEHGKPEPAQRMHYVPVRIEEVTTDADVQEITRRISIRGQFDKAAQAAIWHLQNDMSWDELAAKMYDRVGVPDTPYFTAAEVRAARGIVAQARVLATARREAAADQTNEEEPAYVDRVERMRREQAETP